MTMKAASIIVSTYNRANMLKQVLNALLKQLTSHKYEIIVVNDNSKDSTKDVLNQYRKNKRIKIINLKKTMGPAITRNIGIKFAKYPVVIVMDDDCIASPTWLENMLKPFSDKKVGISSHYYVKIDGERIFGGTSTAYLKEAVEKVGYFDYRYTALPLKFTIWEDTDLVFRILNAGYKAVYAKGANFHHLRVLPRKVIDKISYVLKRIWIHQADVLLFKKHPFRASKYFDVTLGFLIPPMRDFKKATGLWKGSELSLSSPQGVVFIHGDKFLSKLLIIVSGIFYAFVLKLVRLYGSIRYGKLLL